jgi:protein TonB
MPSKREERERWLCDGGELELLMSKGFLIHKEGRERPILAAISFSLLLHAVGGWFFLLKVQNATIHRQQRSIEISIVTRETPEPLPPPTIQKPPPFHVSRTIPAALPKKVVSITPAEDVKVKADVAVPSAPHAPALPSGRDPAVSGPTTAGRNVVKKSEVSGQIVGPSYDAAYLNNPVPRYPPVARKLKLQGTAIVRVLVSTDGRPQNVRLENASGVRILDEAAVEAVWHWLFVPARRGDTPIAAEVDVPVRFRLD